MKKALAALLGSALFTVALIPVGHYPIASAAQPSPVPTYCAPPIAIVAGHEAKAAEIQSDLQHAEQCSGQYGDIYTDGVFYNSTASFSGSSLSVTFPQNVVVVVGQRVYVAASTQTVPASATSYWFLDAATGAWSSSLTNTPPTSTAELQYTVIANSSGVTSVSYGISQSSTPVYASLILSGSATAQSITVSGQAGHAGYMATYDGNGVLQATATPTPDSLLCPNAGTNITVTGTYPCTVNSTAVGGVSSIVAGQNITLTPSGGTGNVTVAETVTPGPQATPSPVASPGVKITSTWPYNIGIDLTNPFVWSGLHTFGAGWQSNGQSETDFNAVNTCSNNTANALAIGELCLDGTSIAGVVLGPQSGVWSGGSATADSQRILFCKSVSGTQGCGASLYFTSGGTITFSGAGISTGNATLNVGTAALTAGQLLQHVTKDFAGQCTTSSSTTCTATIVASFTTPICFAQDITTLVLAKCTVSGTTVTVTLASSETADTVNFLVIGNPT